MSFDGPGYPAFAEVETMAPMKARQTTVWIIIATLVTAAVVIAALLMSAGGGTGGTY